MARINVRVKGADGEREIATRLNYIIDSIREERELPPLPEPQVQRNQNQTAVGGCDLIGTYVFAIEVKRQEALSLDRWWQQAVVSAAKTGAIPVVIFRQNRKAWRVMMPGTIIAGGFGWTTSLVCRSEVSFTAFEDLFTEVVKANL